MDYRAGAKPTLHRQVFVFEIMKQLIVLLLTAQALAQELNSTLHSTFYGVPIAYVGEIVVFTCEVRGSNSMGWMSDDYIGTNRQQLELSSADLMNTSYTAIGDNQTVATLISATLDQVIISRLWITIKPGDQTASIQCRNSSDNTLTSTTFLLADATSVTCDRLTVCPGETVTCACTTGNSNTLVWMIDGSRLTFTSTEPLLTRRNMTGSSTFAVLTENSDRNRVRVIMSNITVSVSMSSIDPEVILTCENVDRAMKKTVILPVVDYCPMAQVVTPAESKPQRGSCSRPIATAVAPVSIFLILALLIGISVVLILLYKYISLRRKYNPSVAEYETNENGRENEESGGLGNTENHPPEDVREMIPSCTFLLQQENHPPEDVREMRFSQSSKY